MLYSRRSALGLLAASSFASVLPARAAEPSSARIRIGQIGTAHSHAAGKMEAVRQLADFYEVVGVAEADDALRRKVESHSAYAGLTWKSREDLLATPGLQAVVVETTLAEAPAAARAAIDAGYHVHLDKPGAARHADFKAMRLAAEQRGVTVQMGYMLRYNPAFQLLFKAVREGWLGEITEIDAAMGKLADDRTRDTLRGFPGAGMFELACHLVDAVVTLLGRPSAVHAFPRATRAPGDTLPDSQLAVLEYAKATVTLRCNHADPFGGPHRRFSVIGTKGAMEIEPLESGRFSLLLSEARGDFAKGTQTGALKVPPGRYDGEFRDLAAVIRGEKKLAWDAAHDIAVHETALRAAGQAVE